VHFGDEVKAGKQLGDAELGVAEPACFAACFAAWLEAGAGVIVRRSSPVL
jgi:hypothetical protein